MSQQDDEFATVLTGLRQVRDELVDDVQPGEGAPAARDRRAAGRAGRADPRSGAARGPGALGVLPGEVGQAGDGRDLADRGVGPVVVVLVDPGREGLSAG